MFVLNLREENILQFSFQHGLAVQVYCEIRNLRQERFVNSSCKCTALGSSKDLSGSLVT